ncbi:hypothetical protein HK100_000811 [Physocladia obscura]|uniref:Cystathionine gamma-synthase n=1 Tax=Physocladia obscura TaxID=109957 RepID=A0AAD5XEZ5_9FUNG|nr:hypothetical protein HK100_000811 [Physocladia obscura]
MLLACSVSLPTWDANVKYEQGDPAVLSTLKCGYPRFVYHPLVKQVFDHFEKKFGRPGEACIVYPTSRVASEAREFMKSHIKRNPQTFPISLASSIRIAEFAIQPIYQSASPAAADPTVLLQQRTVFVYSLLFPQAAASLAKMFWQHSGEGISSRLAEYCLKVLGSNKQSVEYYNSTAIGDRFATSGFSKKDQGEKLITASKNAEDFASKLFLEERYGRNLDLTFASEAKVMLRQRIAGVLADSVDSSDEDASVPYNSNSNRIPLVATESVRELEGLNEGQVFLFPTGMSAIYNAFRVVRKIQPDLKTVQFGFPYTDTLKIQEKFGAGCIFLGHGTTADLDNLESMLASGEKIAALFCEFPSNPLLKSSDLKRIRKLANQHDFLVVVDETIGNFYNVDVLPWADIVVSSLTKIFSGDCNVMGGSAVLNPYSFKYQAIKEAYAELYEDTMWEEDAIFLERNSRNFVARTNKINETAAKLTKFLHGHPKVQKVHYPLFSDFEIYKAHMRTGGGYGGLFSVILPDAEGAVRFYDHLDVAKGPSLGTNFTLVSPYTILAHFTELDWAESFGVASRLLRVSVGLEDADELVNQFSQALELV